MRGDLPQVLGDGRILLESDCLRAIIDPIAGGRIRSLVSKITGREFLYQDPRTTFSGLGYSDNDISGYCECFPTIARCEYPGGMRRGLDLGDHGRLWQQEWDVEVQGETATLSKYVPELECRFTRSCVIESPCTLGLRYAIHNHGDVPVDYIYSAHPLLNAGPHTRLEFPKEMTKAFVYVAINAPGLKDRSWIAWPQPGDPFVDGPLSPDRESVIKLFSGRLSSGWAAVVHTDTDESLLFRFDTTFLPYLGVLVSQGYYGSYDALRGSVFLGVEPTTAIGDDLPTGISTGTIKSILPGRRISFWIDLTLAANSRGSRLLSHKVTEHTEGYVG